MRAKGFATSDDNEADALAVLQWGLSQQLVEGGSHG
jgi:hypothetical protein